MKRAIKKSKSLSSRGSSLIIVLLIALIVAGGVFFTNGLFTDTNKVPLDLTAYTPSTKQFDDNRVVLQLKTLNFESCGDTAALGFLVDQSGSMNYVSSGSTKEDKLKNALNVFATNFPSGGITGLTTFSDHSLPGVYFVPINLFKNNKSQFISKVNSMVAIGGTMTRTAFEYEKTLLDSAKAKYPNNQFNLVFISDGVPETSAGNACAQTAGCPLTCGVHPDGTPRCFDTSQDPTSVANEIKNSGIRIFSIGYVSSEDDTFKNILQTLMTNVASPGDFYPAPSNGEITNILQQIVTKVCKAQP